MRSAKHVIDAAAVVGLEPREEEEERGMTFACYGPLIYLSI